jgi:hypothetical protein
VNSALSDRERIRELVSAGYVVRTRTDADTQHARDDEYSKDPTDVAPNPTSRGRLLCDSVNRRAVRVLQKNGLGTRELSQGSCFFRPRVTMFRCGRCHDAAFPEKG